ncbi:MAG TPA: bifunctional precorrin-2 dehydrogenase/sirohydrochlorin ferrochelatase [Acidimicrobiales bacterium]|nr:bifunctional precorrin-2 dehydrogenase/sirohydrochlorin ferrochelatase [Acidimicrobiales bacterium]
MTDPAPPPPSFYPVALDVTGRACLVVGGGPVAARKARTLLQCGATVSVIAPSLSHEMEALVEELAQVERRAYASGDAARFRLVVTATGRADVDSAVHDDAEAAGVWVNSADDRAHSSFILPAVHRDGPVTVAVSTSGLSPALASWLRSRVAAECGEGAGAVAQLFGEAREQLRLAGRRSDSVDWAALLDGPLIELVRAGEWDKARAMVAAATTA